MKINILKSSQSINIKNAILTYGHFNTIHPGHIRYLRYAASQGKNLVVAVVSDISNVANKSYQFSQKERAESLASFYFINSIVLLENDEFALSKLIKKIKPKLLVLGTEFEKTKDSGIKAALKLMYDSKKNVKFHAGDVQYASTQLLDNSKNDLFEINKKKFHEACKRQNIRLNDLLISIDSWKKTNLLVVGDAILDQYAGCEPIGMSAEAPVLVVKELQRKNFIGGAAIVSCHIRSLGANCTFLSVVGNDDSSKVIEENLISQGVSCELIRDESRPTTFKKRYIVENQKLFRVSRLNDHSLNENIEKIMLQKLEEIAPNVDGIVVSDFVYGVITDKVLKKVLLLAKKYKLKIFGDLQCSSQIGLVTKFKNFNLICPNEKEARIGLQDKESGLEILSHNLMSKTNSKMLVMKLGPQGFISYQKLSSGEYNSQSFPSLSINPVDVSGAGDSLLSVMATGLSSNGNLMANSAIGCCMAALAVENMGNKPIGSSSLKDFLKSIFKKTNYDS